MILALALRALVIQAYRIPSGSMEDTLLAGDYLMAIKLPFGVRDPFFGKIIVPAFRHPKRGEVLIFRYPLDGRDFIKRCAAEAGDTVAVRGGELYVNGIRDELPQIRHKATGTTATPYHQVRTWNQAYQSAWEQRKFLQIDYVRDDFGPVAVPTGQLFMMGDNRDNSMDSRFWGPLAERDVVGKALAIYWSWDPEGRAPAWQFWNRVRWKRIGRIIR